MCRKRTWAFILATMLVGGSGCDSTYRCTGSAIRCESFTPEYCANVPGCVAGDICILYSADSAAQSCGAKVGASDCLAPRCSWSGTTCQDICDTVTDIQTCNGIHSAEKTDPPVDYVWECAWVHCHGKPVKTVCSDYSNDSCPRELGCTVEKVYAF